MTNENETTNYYVDRDEMWEEVNRLYHLYPEGTEVIASDSIALMFYKICNKLKSASNFTDYTYDLASEAFELVLKKFRGRKFKLWMQQKNRLETVDENGKKRFAYEPVYEDDGRPKMVRSNFFGYVTTMAYRSFLSTIDREQKYREGVENYREQVYSEFETENSLMKPRHDDGDNSFFNDSD